MASDFFLRSWLSQHSFVAWLLQHPLLSLGLLFVVLVFLFRLFAALAELLDRLWLWLLRSPILLFKSLFGLGKKASDPTAVIVERVSPISAIESETMSQVLIKLENIEQQQTQIMAEIAALKEQFSKKVSD